MNAIDAAGRGERRTTPPPAAKTGVRGWLLALCVMFTIVGPLMSIGLAHDDYRRLMPYFDASRGAEVATWCALVATACSVAYGIHAGIRLWTVSPGAVRVAKRSLLVALAVEVFTTTVRAAVAGWSMANADLVDVVFLNLVPGLLFFTLCLGYLNKSTRVEATYRSTESDD